MYLFCIDESGCTGALPVGNVVIQPVLVLGGIIIEYAKLEQLTYDLMDLKAHYYPGSAPRSSNYLDWIRVEIKGADLRKQARGNRDDRRFAHFVMNSVLALLEKHDVKILARVYIKEPGGVFTGQAAYPAAVRTLTDDFHHFLEAKGKQGVVLLDHRNRPKNADVAHGIFTQKFKNSHDKYQSLLDMPLFGHSDNHAGLQASDILCSAILFPTATYTYCMGKVTNDHVHYLHGKIRDQFGPRLKALQYRYQSDLAGNRWKGGIVTSDRLGNEHSALIFGAPTPHHYHI